jgi:mitochondrial ribonuclease P protein 3
MLPSDNGDSTEPTDSTADQPPAHGASNAVAGLKRPSSSGVAPTAVAKRKKGDTDGSRQFRGIVQQCCRTNDTAPALRAYEQAVRDGIPIEACTFYSLLNLCCATTTDYNPGPKESVTAGSTIVVPFRPLVHIGTPKQRIQQQQPQSEESSPNEASKKVEEEPPTAVDLPTRLLYANKIKTHMDNLKLPLVETAYTSLIRVLCQTLSTDVTSPKPSPIEPCEETKDPVGFSLEHANKSESEVIADIESILTEAENTNQCHPKLRMYTPVIQLYSERGMLQQALQTWIRLSRVVSPANSQGSQGSGAIVLSEREYGMLLHCSTIAGSRAAFEYVLSNLAEDVLVPSKGTIERILAWFRSPFSIQTLPSNNAPAKEDSADEVQGLLDQLQGLLSVPLEVNIGPMQCPADFGWHVSEKCQVNASTGELVTGCLRGRFLQPLSLAPSSWRSMRLMNEDIVVSGKIAEDSSQFLGGRKGSKRKLTEKTLLDRRQQWDSFKLYFENRLNASGPVDIVIDGANVGYYEQNYADAPKHVCYEQIDWVVRYFVQVQRKSVLLILHSRHCSRPLLPAHAESIVHSWRQPYSFDSVEGHPSHHPPVLFATPFGMNDDWFWMHAALFVGPQAHVVTNDEMRDHHFQMLSPRTFVKWRDRQRIRFRYQTNKDVEIQLQPSLPSGRVFAFQYPDVYSRRIQCVQLDRATSITTEITGLCGLVVPNPRRSDENRLLDLVRGDDGCNGDPVEDVAEDVETYLCIAPLPKESPGTEETAGAKLG